MLLAVETGHLTLPEQTEKVDRWIEAQFGKKIVLLHQLTPHALNAPRVLLDVVQRGVFQVPTVGRETRPWPGVASALTTGPVDRRTRHGPSLIGYVTAEGQELAVGARRAPDQTQSSW